MKDPGNLIKADETLLTTIVTLNPMYVYFDVDERTVLGMRGLIEQKKIKTIRDMTFRFELANDEGKFPYEGRIDFEDNKLDASTGTLQLRGIFNNAKGFSPGQFVRLRLYVGVPRKAVLVPERALGTDQGQKFIYAVKRETDKEGKPAFKAEYRGGNDLQLGALRDGWRVVEKGVEPGELVIWSGLQRVRKDASITAKEMAPPSAK
jgi:RND family efflux transporter MFP subunit